LTTRRKVVGWLGATTLAGCAAPSVVTRGDNDPFEGGIGGTGIVGVLTDFGSLIVNGVRVEMTGATRVQTAFGAASTQALRPGQALTILAHRGRDRMVARTVQITWPLVGQVRHGPTGFLINGARVVPEANAVGRLVPGQRVAASGLWTQQGLVASRIDPITAQRDVLAGTLAPSGPTGLTVEGVPVRHAGPRLKRLGTGTFVTLLGHFDGSSFAAETVQAGRFRTSTAALRLLSVEGYLEPVSHAPGFRIAGLGHSFARNVRLGALAQRRAIYFGPYTGLFGAHTGYVVPEDFASRRTLLRDGYGNFAGAVIRTR